MFRKITAIGLALGLILPGYSVLAQTAQERTEKQEMVQKGSSAAGEQERIQERDRTRDEKQTRDHSGEAKMQKKKGSSAKAAGDQLHDRDRDKDQTRDRDRAHQGSGMQTRSGGGGR